MNKVAVLVALLVGSSLGVATQKPGAPSLPVVLADAAGYLAAYAATFGAIVCEERTHEIAAIGNFGGRTIRSDVALIGSETAGWLAFRDAFEVDGQPLRPRDTRLIDVLNGPPAAALDGARRLNGEGTRHHLGVQSMNRAINAPMLALLFLRRDNQGRSDFVLDGVTTIDGAPAALVTFKERSMPRVLRTTDDVAATGKFWIQPGTGRVVRTELSMKSPDRQLNPDLSATITARIAVRYANQPALALWLPIRLDEEFEVTAGRAPSMAQQTITGRADFSNFRKLAIDVSQIVR